MTHGYSAVTPPNAADPPAGFFAKMGIAALTGSLGATVFGVYDVLYHGPTLGPLDVMWGALLGHAVGLPIWLGLSVILVFGMRAARQRLCIREWSALQVGLLVASLAAVVIFYGTRQTPNDIAILLLLLSFAVASVCYQGMVRWRLAKRAGFVAALLSFTTVVLLFAGVLVLWASRGGVSRGMAWVLGAVAATIAFVPAFRLRESPSRMVAASLVLLLPLGPILARSGVVVAAAQQRAPTRLGDAPPDVLLIVLDTTRRDMLGCYGHTGGLTPVLDSLAAEGTVYENAISPAAWTVPSHASMFTGLYPVTHGCTNAKHLWLEDSFSSLAEMLKSQGYSPAALASNEFLAKTNLLQGFDHVRMLGTGTRILALRPMAMVLGWPMHWCDKGGQDAAVELERWLATPAPGGRPRFTFINLVEAHGPYLAPSEQRERFAQVGMFDRHAARVALDLHLHVVDHHVMRDGNAAAMRLARAMYEAEVAYQDRCLGQIVDRLRKYTDFDNTLVLVTADHGENLGEGGRCGHLLAANDALIHVPLVIRWPRGERRPARVEGLCQTIDFVPTIFDVLGRDCPVPGLPGRTLVPERFEPRREAFAQLSPFYQQLSTIQATLGFQAGLRDYGAEKRIIRTERYRFSSLSNGNETLYDVVKDPQETENLVDALPDVARDLRGRLAEWWNKQSPFQMPKTAAVRKSLKHDAVDRLRGMGYFN